MKTLFANSILLLGSIFLLFSLSLGFVMYSPTSLNFGQAPPSIQAASAQPTRIIIDSIHLDIPIIPSVIKNNVWETTTQGVSYLQTSPIPGDKGNSILYGHNWLSLLGSLPYVRPGQIIKITMSDGTTRTFTIDQTAVISPTQASVVNPTLDTRLTIYTCTGFLDTKRFVVVAKPV